SGFSRFPAIADPPSYGTNLSQVVDHFQGAIPGAIEAKKGLSIKKKLLCWGAYLLLAVVPTFFLVQVWPSETSTVLIYSSSDEENSLVGPITATVFMVSVFAVGWSRKLLGNALKNRIFGTDAK
ncbi:hypothetical protein, partial [Roseovarius lutimaris]|uniref:hypothetical protein n=1 Tax=Roseovarius lutimaris TaxID=1005928 RepID=UPI001C42EE13